MPNTMISHQEVQNNNKILKDKFGVHHNIYVPPENSHTYALISFSTLYWFWF
jgi:hypothetical protein